MSTALKGRQSCGCKGEAGAARHGEELTAPHLHSHAVCEKEEGPIEVGRWSHHAKAQLILRSQSRDQRGGQDPLDEAC